MSKKLELRKAVGYRLKQLRESLSFTQDKMAAYFETGRSSYVKNELGDSFPNYLVLEKLGKDFDLSLDWLICAKGPMLFKEKEIKQEKAAAPAEKEPQEERPLSPETRELLDHMEKVPLLRHEIMVYFHKFKMANKELVEEAMALNLV